VTSLEGLIRFFFDTCPTIKLIAKLKDENSDELGELQQLPEVEVMQGLKETLNELKMCDILFKDQKRALQEMEKEGMIPAKHLKAYQKNPELLEEDTRKGLYFRFVSLAVVGGYL
jgi:hypothetical protein